MSDRRVKSERGPNTLIDGSGSCSARKDRVMPEQPPVMTEYGKSKAKVVETKAKLSELKRKLATL